MSSLVIFIGSDDFGVALLNEGLSLTVTLGKLDEGLLAGANHENVGETGSEGVTSGVLDVDDLVGTGVVLNVHE